MRRQTLLMVMVAASSACGAALADSAGVAANAATGWRIGQPDAASDSWFSTSRLQGRLGLATSSPRLGRLDAFPGSASESSRLESLSLMGDYYFSQRGGLRATGGVFLGSRATTLWTAQPAFDSQGAVTGFAAERRSFSLANPAISGGDSYGDSAVPYLGVGYTGVPSALRSGVGSRAGSWGFTADLGLMALNSRSTVRFGRAVGGQQNFDDFLRELRLAPVVQLGVSYSF